MSNYRLSITGPDFQFERELDEITVARVITAVLLPAEKTPVAARALLDDNAPSPPRPKVSVGEFVRRTGASSNAERVAVIGLYLRDYLGQPGFRREELPGWFQKAGLPTPKNMWRDVAKAVKQQLIAEDHSAEGSYYLTLTGEEQLSR